MKPQVDVFLSADAIASLVSNFLNLIVCAPFRDGDCGLRHWARPAEPPLIYESQGGRTSGGQRGEARSSMEIFVTLDPFSLLYVTRALTPTKQEPLAPKRIQFTSIQSMAKYKERFFVSGTLHRMSVTLFKVRTLGEGDVIMLPRTRPRASVCL